ncbi:MAG TPA: hypothetical protein VF584_01330 [Longimicrobium sp.]|jgi:hypothetical protein
MSKTAIQRTVEVLVGLLASENYAEIESMTAGTRMSKQDIAGSVAEYGRTIVVPPTTAYEQLDSIEVTAASSRTWSVTMPLWTVEEGRSDLTMELTLVEQSDGTLKVELDNLHVL